MLLIITALIFLIPVYSYSRKSLKKDQTGGPASAGRVCDKTRILLFDGVCNLCTGIAQFTHKRDLKGKFRLDTLQSEFGQLLLKQFDLPSNDFKSFVYIEDDIYFLRSTAVLHVLKELGGLWKLFYCFIIFPLPWRDFVYNLIAKTRYKIFGKRVTCMIPDHARDKVIPE